MIETLKFDCKHFKGNSPCKPNKLYGKICSQCDEYTPIDKKILIIKLGAIGDVIRTTPLIVKYRELYPNCHISWITLSPQVLPQNLIDEIYTFEYTAIFKAMCYEYDIAVNLDKEPEACQLLRQVKAREKYGFIWTNHHIDIATRKAAHKLITGLFDDISAKNTRNYLDEIFEICHLNFNKEPYLLNFDETLAKRWQKIKEQAKGKTIIGLNTGCGTRWTTRLWPQSYWIAFIQELQAKNLYPALLGGKAEDEGNRIYAKQTSAYYPGYYSLEEFIALSSHCDLIVTQVSMMMHIAIGLKKPIVLMNNIFNKHEFELYGKGIIVEPSSGCSCYYGNACTREKTCMHDISVENMISAVKKLLR